MTFATDSEGICGQCKMKGRIILCPLFKVKCDKKDKRLAQGKQGTLEKKVETLNNPDKELE